MKSIHRTMPLLSLCLFFLLASPQAFADKIPYSKKQLEKTATHIVVGKVQSIYSRKERKGNYEYTRFVAEVKIDKLEKGQGLKDLVYVRYFSIRWIGLGQVPPGGGSYHPQPNTRDPFRFYLARNAYDGYSLKGPQDGGFNVVYVNGIQPIKK